MSTTQAILQSPLCDLPCQRRQHRPWTLSLATRQQVSVSVHRAPPSQRSVPAAGMSATESPTCGTRNTLGGAVALGRAADASAGCSASSSCKRCRSASGSGGGGTATPTPAVLPVSVAAAGAVAWAPLALGVGARAGAAVASDSGRLRFEPVTGEWGLSAAPEATGRRGSPVGGRARCTRLTSMQVTSRRSPHDA